MTTKEYKCTCKIPQKWDCKGCKEIIRDLINEHERKLCIIK